jgi:ATP-dependent DNA helicase UvrD/PcrA
MPAGSAASLDADAVLEGLDPEQREVATALVGPVCVLAGAGTGKTRAITHRIAHGVLAGRYRPASLLAVTFTARAAGEMRGRLRELGVGGVQARTFHSAALRQLQFFWPRAVGGEPPRILERKAALVAEAVGRCRERADRTVVRDLISEIEWAKVTQTPPDDYPHAATKAGRQPPRDEATVARVYAAYEDIKRDRRLIDFEDVLLLTVGVLSERDDVAGTVREQYEHFVVDEYQDVNPLQQRLLDLWLGGRDNLCVVGDASQTIYSFTGATPDYLLGFRHRYPNATLVRLVRDYRSTPQVVRLANGLLARASGHAADQRLELLAQRPSGPAPTFTEYPDETAEADGVAARIRELVVSGVRAGEIAVLFRVNSVSESYEQALAAAGVPYLLRGAERFFDRPEVRQSVTLLRGAARAGRDGTSSGPGGGPGNGPGTDPGTGPGAGGLVDEVRSVLAAAGWTSDPPGGSGAVRERWESVASLVALAEQLADADPAADLTRLVTELDERAAAQHAPSVDGVTLASLHAAKGLEWDAVFLVGLTEGMVPITHAQTPEQIEEERRLLYVGVTRAREHLALSWALARNPGGRAGRRPSRFLDGLRPDTGSGRSDQAIGGARTRGSRRRGPVSCRVCGRPLSNARERKLGRCEGCPSSFDEALFERLRAWRLARATAQGVPAFVVFTDATLTAVAEAVPTTPGELARIPGVGARKLERYGDEVLGLCAPPG